MIASTVLGLDPVDREDLFMDFEIWCQGLFSFPLTLPGSPFTRARQARQRLLLVSPWRPAASTCWPVASMKPA